MKTYTRFDRTGQVWCVRHADRPRLDRVFVVLEPGVQKHGYTVHQSVTLSGPHEGERIDAFEHDHMHEWEFDSTMERIA